ncbi:hypothetical protein BX285_4194 [Streptomyces sp. 1114.5]|uniref:hypothetical protein n=1 Tax=unclassified Streptomyces TaxID=2593676 RepID=UPI000BD1CC98|nr:MULTISPECIES: hypothetical protein [unclassified Streptomyces]RKT19725.1 hypothetical protein BX285_4194 [Streptomyces sp. 1114.5]SOB85924.1 hypothetical protein SAMN06272789_6225 [Streptomyces sp. 1331.2]
MAVFRRPGRSRPTPEPDLGEQLAELVEESEHPEQPGRGGPLAARAGQREGRGRAVVLHAARLLGHGGRATARGAAYGGKALAEQLVQAAPRIPVRGLATLRAQHPGAASPEQLADLLVTGAVRASGALGAGVGAAAMMPVPPAMPVEIAAETLAVAAVEIKLIAELHEVYGFPAQGSVTQRAGAYLGAWANRRGIDATLLVRPAGFAALAIGAEVRQQVRRRLTRSSLRHLPALMPLLVGAGIGATMNRRETRRLAEEVRVDLRSRPPADRAYWAAAAPVVKGGRLPEPGDTPEPGDAT